MPAVKNQALSSSFVRSVKESGAYTDGGGLVLRVADNGRKTWIQRISVGGKQRNLGLGAYPAVGLADARQTAIENSRAIALGRNPIEEKRQAKEDAKAAAAPEPTAPSIPTFREAAQAVIELRAPTWSSSRHAKQWIESLTNHAYPVLADLSVDEIASSDILRMLTPVWTAKPETARRVRQRTETILDFAIVQGWRTTPDNPAGKAVTRVLPKTSQFKEHHKALPYQDLPTALERVRESTADKITRLAYQFVVLTAGRAGEIRGATWSEIDWDSRTWEIPAARMKARRPHRVPLSNRAIEILREAWEISGPDGLIFPTKRSGKAMSNMVFEMLLRRLEIESTVHGSRSSFKDWAIEQTAFPWIVSEAALAHRLGDSTESAYARSDLFEQRRQLMQQWADYLSG